MFRSKSSIGVLQLSMGLTLVACCVITDQAFSAGETGAGIEEIVVTAERRASTVQNTAIAISAFAGEALEMRQIDTAADLQFSVPNMLFTKNQFSTPNIAIRGVSNGTGINVNGHYLVWTGIFEAEFFDIERIEVLRGPQGTLYGRNTTGGILNVITKRPRDEFGGEITVEVGNYNTRKINGVVNVPLTDSLATRFSFYKLDRDGYTDNLYTGNDIDDRDLYQLRWTTDFQFSDNTNASLMVSYFKEDDRRSRVSKQLCTKDPRGAYGTGCSPDSKGFGVWNDQATIQTALIGIVNANAAFAAATGGPALPSYGPAPSTDSAAFVTYKNALKSSYYNALKGIVGEAAATAAFNAYEDLGFDDTIEPVDSFADSVNPADMRKVIADFDPEFYLDETIASLEINHQFSNFTLTSITGITDSEYWGFVDYDWAVPSVKYPNGPITYKVDGRDRVATFSEGVDRAGGLREQWSQQFTLVSDFSGKFNFTTGAYYLAYESDTSYNVYFSDLYEYSRLGGHRSILNAVTGGLVPAPPLPEEKRSYDTRTLHEMDTWALFSELYYEFNDTTKLTVGLRYTNEEQDNDVRLFFGDLSSGNHRIQNYVWKETTGKIGIDHDLDLSFTDQTLLYASVARGFKSGGFNSASTVEGLYPEFYEPENVDTYELGMKNRLMNNRLQANLTAFYSTYNDMQVQQIINQSSVIVNTDSEIRGLEAEFMFAPTENWLFSLNLAFLNAEVKDFTAVDPADSTQGGPVLNIFGNIYDATTGQRGNTSIDLDGNDLANTPSQSINFFVDYTQPLSNGMMLVYHADYFYQDEYYARDFNTDADLVDSWDVSNASLTLNSASENWSLRLWIKNLQDDDNVTGHYIQDGVSAFFTNEFILEPRTYGLSFNMKF